MSEDPLVVGNWKANGSLKELEAWAKDFVPAKGVHAVVCPPAPYVARAAELLGGRAEVGAQDVSRRQGGSNTGETHAEMLRDCGARWAIVGHSERRQNGEDDIDVRLKLLNAAAGGLRPILCVGETLEEREAGRLEEVVARQIDMALTQRQLNLPITLAYEPVWAIGTGKAATAKQAADSCKLAGRLAQKRLGGARIPVLYGGSVKADNAAGFAGRDGIDGLLVGGASLKGESFSAICSAAAKTRSRKKPEPKRKPRRSSKR